MENEYYDKHTIYVKETKLDEIINKYKCFGWELINKVDNKKYEALVDLTFSRPHKIDNKNELQLLQVYMEERFNNIARCERLKNTKSTIFGLCYGLIAIFILVVGILISTDIIALPKLIAGIPLTIFAISMIIVESIILPKIIIKENKEFKIIRCVLEKELDQICLNAKNLLLGDKNEK